MHTNQAGGLEGGFPPCLRRGPCVGLQGQALSQLMSNFLLEDVWAVQLLLWMALNVLAAQLQWDVAFLAFLFLFAIRR